MRQPFWVVRLLVIAVTLAVSVGVFPASAQAQTNDWINPGDGAWQDPASWSLAQAPATNHFITITNANTKVVQLDATTSGSFSNTMTVTDVILSAPNGATNILALSDTGTTTPLHVLNNFDITAGGMLSMSNAALLMETNGAFSLDGSAVCQATNSLSGDVYVGFASNSIGSVSLLDGQTLLTNGCTVIGFYGSGHVVLPSAKLQFGDTNSIGNSVFLGLASGSAGDLTVNGGGYYASEHLVLGDESGSTGSVWVSDGQLVITNDYLITVGNSGVGQLTLSNSQLIASHTIVGASQGSQGTLTIAGGTGSFSGAISVGVVQGATGTVLITSGELLLTNQYLIIGDFGDGQMLVSNSTLIARTMIVGHNNGSRGTLTFAGGIATLTSNLLVGQSGGSGLVSQVGGSLNVGGRLDITAGGMLLMTNAALLVETNGAFSLDGSASLYATNSLAGDLYVGFSTNSSSSIDFVDGQHLLTNGFTVIGFYGSGQAFLSNGILTVADILSGTNDNYANGVMIGLASGAVGDLTVVDGTYHSPELLTLGDEAGSTGSVWVSDGQFIVATNDYLLTIGNYGVGQLTLSNGQLAASYVIVASGPASQGALMIAGGTGILSRALSVGVGQGATGTVSITGGQLVVTNHSVIVGDYGVGQMTVSNGAFRARTVIVGHNQGSQGTLTISGGITSVASNLVAGAYSNATGVIQVTGGELNITNQLGTGQLVIGQMGSGVFTQEGGTLIVDQLVAVNGTNSIFNFSSGTFNTKSTTVSNTQIFVVGDGFGSATYHLLGGVHTFNDGLRIANAATLSGCGTIVGDVVVDKGGRIVADCGGNLTFTGILTNNGLMRAANGSTLESYGTVVNNGVIDILSGHTNFHGAFINNGLVLDADSIPRIVSIEAVGQDVEFWFTTSPGAIYIIEYRTDLSSGDWISALGVVGTGGNIGVIDPGAALLPHKFYRVRLEVPE